MYVNPFWFGVFLTIVVEILLCIGYAVYENNKGGKR